MPAICPTCDATLPIPEGTEVSEILTCSDCQTRLVVQALTPEVKINIAPAVEEDWGE